MREATNQGRLIGYVQLQVGARTFAVPVEAVRLERDRMSNPPGGFFRDEEGGYGIYVDEDASPAVVQAQIASASADAVRHIAKRFLN